MAYVSCAAKIAANIQQDCNKPLVGGYTGRAVIMSANDFARAEVVRSASNPREILSIVLPPDGSVMAYTIDNVFAQPFTGSTTAGNNENGRNGYLKTLSVRVPMRGADVSKDVIEPLVKSADGFVAIVEKRDKVGDGSYEVIGYQNALRGDIAGVTRDESANGGDWIVPLTTVETWAEVTLVGSAETYESAKKEFEGLFGFEPQITRMVLTEDSGGEVNLSANGLVIVEYMQDGEKVRNTYSALSNTYVPIPAGVEATIYGAVTAVNGIGDPNIFYSLDVSKNIALTELHCTECTELTSLDVSKNILLTTLYCDGCTGLTSLDVSKNTALTNLHCGSTSLTSLDVSKNIALTELYCHDCTGLTLLDVSKNILLTELYCSGCTGLTSLDVSKNIALTNLHCGSTSLTSLDLSKNTALTYLACGGCTGLTSLDVSKNTALGYLDCSNCRDLTSLDLSKNTALTSLDCSVCTGLTSLDVSKNTALGYLDCSNCQNLLMLNIKNTALLESGGILDQSMANLTTLQVAGTSAWAYEQVESWLSDFAPDGGKIYVDDNTPQGVITETEGKSWEVIYQA